MSAVQHICNSFMWNILGKTKIIEKIWQSLITHESKKFPVSLGSELINVATQISMWPCKKILQINKRSPTFIRQTRVLACKNLPIGFKKMAAVLHLRPIGKCLGLQALHSVHTLLIWWLIWCRLDNDPLQGTYCILSFA